MTLMYIYYTIDTTTSSSNNNNLTGSVLWIEHLPHTSTLLVGYTQGTVALWDISTLTRLHNLPLYQYGPVLMAMKTQDSLSQAQHKQAKLSRFKRPLFGDTSLFSNLLNNNTTTAAITATTGNGSSTAVGILGGKDNNVATLPAAIAITHATGTTSTTTTSTTTTTTSATATATTDTIQPATSRSPSRTRLSSTATATSGTSTTDPSPIAATRKSLHTADGGEQYGSGEEYSR